MLQLVKILTRQTRMPAKNSFSGNQQVPAMNAEVSYNYTPIALVWDNIFCSNIAAEIKLHVRHSEYISIVSQLLLTMERHQWPVMSEIVIESCQ